MPFTDMPRSELVKYAPDLPWPEDLEEFWSATLADSRALVETPVIERIDTGLTVVDSFGSAAPTDTGTGRVWGASASRAPIRMTLSTPSSVRP